MSHPSIFGSRYDRATRQYIDLNQYQQEALRSLNAALDRGEIALENTVCSLCYSDDSEIIASIDRYFLRVVTAICTQCGLVYRSQRLARDSEDKFYNEFYHPLFKGRMTNQQYFNNQRAHGAFVFAFVADIFQAGMHVA